MKNFSRPGLIACLCLSLSPGLWAQDSDTWQWRVIPYLWGLNVDGAMEEAANQGVSLPCSHALKGVTRAL